jgi:hypothetical protein
MSSGKIIIVITGLLLCIIALCCIGIYLFQTDSNPIPISTPPLQQIPIEQIIANTSSAAQTQTMIFAPPTFTPFTYNTPSTLIPVTLMPVTLAPSFTPIPTDTPFLYVITIPSGSGENCSCSGDLYNCTEHFSTQAQAQACYEHCVSLGYGDIHRLDQGGQPGVACEELP